MGDYGFSTYASIANFELLDKHIWISTRWGKINYFLR